MIRSLLVPVALTAAMLPAAATAAEKTADKTAPRGVVAIVLDCSKSMGEAAVPGKNFRQASDDKAATRMQCAQQALRRMLRELAADDRTKVGLWLFGHRLAWEADSDNPQLVSQDAYLEATAGFEALNNLVPGDDVERLQPLRALRSEDVENIGWKLDHVEPWGEKPLYYAISQAMRDLSNEPAGAAKSIIVFTDGGNHQGLARFRTSHDKMLDNLTHQLVPIHFIHVGASGEDAAAERKLLEVAESSGGTLTHLRDSEPLTVAQVLAGSRKATTVVSPQLPGPEASAVAADVAAAAKLLKPAERSVMGSVVFNGRPVLSATLTLEGTGLPPVKTDRQGKFLIRKVPAGKTYKLHIEAVATNKIREADVDLVVEPAAEEQPAVTVDLN